MRPIVWEKTGAAISPGLLASDGFLGKGEIHIWKAILDDWGTRQNDFYAIGDAHEGAPDEPGESRRACGQI